MLSAAAAAAATALINYFFFKLFFENWQTPSQSGSYPLPYDAPLLLTILLPLQHHGLKHSRVCL